LFPELFFKFLSGHFSKKEEEEIRRKIEEEEMKLEKEIWFDPMTQTDDLPHLRRARLPLHL
jgi:hypothetical protein